MNIEKDETDNLISMDYDYYKLLEYIKNVNTVIEITKVTNSMNQINPDKKLTLILALSELRAEYEYIILNQSKNHFKNYYVYMCERKTTYDARTDKRAQQKRQERQLCVEDCNQANIDVTYEQYELFEQISKIDTLIKSQLLWTSQSTHTPNLKKKCHELLTELKKELLNTISQT